MDNLQPATEAPYYVVTVQDGESARLGCATLEEAVVVKRSFVNYGKCQEVRIVSSEWLRDFGTAK